ncbi:MAG: hypothetical protein AAB388_01540 [Patescibacteria group bacterium]
MTELSSGQPGERFVLPHDEMAFRRVYRELLAREAITTVFRPGKRQCGDWRGYCPGDIVTAKVIAEVGLDRARVAPIFLPEPRKVIRIDEVKLVRIGDLEAHDFVNATPDVTSKAQLQWHLGLVYNLDKETLSDDTPITKITFSYQR